MTNQINELIQQAHNNAVTKGFWEGRETNFNHFAGLIITELAEIVEADRKGIVLNLDCPTSEYLTRMKEQKGSVQEEMADVVIRCMDLMGGMKETFIYPHSIESLQTVVVKGTMAEVVFTISALLTTELHRGGISQVVTAMFLIAELLYPFDLLAMVTAKMQYNTSRPPLHNKKY